MLDGVFDKDVVLQFLLDFDVQVFYLQPSSKKEKMLQNQLKTGNLKKNVS